MSEKTAYFILGLEGSGTHMLRNALIEAGCNWKQWHESHHDDYKFEEMPSPFVFHRSYPHAGQSVDILSLIQQLEDADFSTSLLIIVREPNATMKSVLRRDPSREIVPHGECPLSEYWRWMIWNLQDVVVGRETDAVLITYEAFCLSEGFRKWLFTERLQLPYPENFEIKYTNENYYG